MIVNNSYMLTQYLLNKAMKSESLRFSVITNNIANVDTPYFKRSQVVFESQLKKALNDENPYSFRAKKTNKNHFSFYEQKNIEKIEPNMITEHNSVFRNDKNNVDVEKEMVDAAKSTLRYQAFSSFLSRNYRLIRMITR